MLVTKNNLSGSHADSLLLSVEGLIKIGESGEFLAKSIKDATEKLVLIDFSRIDFVDSTGIGEMVGLCAAIQGKKLVFISPGKRISDLCKLIHFEPLTFESQDEAKRYLASQHPR